MQPILDFRNNHLAGEDRAVRDFRRMNGRLTVLSDGLVHGPYTQANRVKLLRELLCPQRVVRNADQQQGTQIIKLLSIEELDELTRLRVVEKGANEEQKGRGEG